ncbi:MAG: MATE family efflux transporter [Candidatus Faecousia sp.]|nr:MATE family efflux transporter [Candidatus Faecousia sp.]
MAAYKKTTARDMTQGSIVKQLVLFSLPLMLGNVFQMLYNTVDSVVVGNFVGTQALAAVGSTTMIVNIMVFFFNGFSTGASVVIARRFGARDSQRLHTAIQTTMAATFILAVFFTVVGLMTVEPMLRLMATPEDVFDEAKIYLQIYIGGFSGLVIYNMCSGILRAVGDTTRPLYFLILTSVLNILLDLFFVLKLRAGIAGVAYATIISQFVSAGLTLLLLTRTRDIYRLSWKGMSINSQVLGEIVAVGLPAAIQSVITSFSNVFVQSYINAFGSQCMAGWSAYNKLDQFVLLPMQSLAMAATTFVSQNIGADQTKRANKGTVITVSLSVGVTAVIVLLVCIFAAPAISLFTPDEAVIEFGVLFVRANFVFLLFNCVNHVLAGALRGRGDSTAPMAIMLLTFVALRQIYLFVVTHYVANTPWLVGFGYPVGWRACCVIEVSYYFLKWGRKKPKRQLLPDC